MIKEESKKVSITMRLEEADAERFKNMALEKNKSQADLLIELMNTVGSTQQPPINNEKIRLLMFRKNRLAKDYVKQNVKTRQYNFNGKAVYYPPQMFECPAMKYKDSLAKEFGIDFQLIAYTMYRVVNVYWDKNKCKHLAQESILIVNKSDMYAEPVLAVSRMLYVSGYEEIAEKFGKYIALENLAGIETVLSEDINDQVDLFDEYF